MNPCEQESFTTLLHSWGHWEFELFVGFIEMLVFDVVLGLIFWPWIKKIWQHYKNPDVKAGS